MMNDVMRLQKTGWDGMCLDVETWVCRRLIILLSFFIPILAVQARYPEGGAARAYFYIEPNCARFECLVPSPVMMSLLGRTQESSLTVEVQKALRDAAREKVADWLLVHVDGRRAMTADFRVMIVKGVPGRTEALQPGETVLSAECMVGLVWEYDLASVPEKIGFTWAGFAEQIPVLVAGMIAGSHREEHELTAGAPSHEWINRGRLAAHTPLAIVPSLPPAGFIRIPLISLLWVFFGLIIVGIWLCRGKISSGKLVILIAIVIGGAVILWPFTPVNIRSPGGAVAPVSQVQAELIVTPLLRNVYRAFDQRQEGAIYDVLARSIEGDLLPQIYLQTINALTLDEQDATRARVTDLGVQIDSVRMIPKVHGFVADVQWTVLGTVGHWGHQHQRVNRYDAIITVKAIPAGEEGAPVWKIVALEVEQKARL